MNMENHHAFSGEINYTPWLGSPMLMRWNVDVDALTLPVNNVLVWRYLNHAASWLVNICTFGGFTPYDLPNFLGVAEGIQDSPFWFWVLRRMYLFGNETHVLDDNP